MFFIHKFNLLGVVNEGKSIIHFYDLVTYQRLKITIELKEIQYNFEQVDVKLNNLSTEDIIEEETENDVLYKIIKKLDKKEKTTSKRKYMKPWLTKSISDKIENKKKNLKEFTSTDYFKTKLPLIFSLKQRLNTDFRNDPKIFSQPRKKQTNFAKNIFDKKLSIVSTLFIDEFDVLLISTTNNKICAWQFSGGDFKNVNSNNEFHIDKYLFKCAVLSSDSPQTTMVWDPIQKALYTGEEYVKISCCGKYAYPEFLEMWRGFINQYEIEEVTDAKELKGVA